MEPYLELRLRGLSLHADLLKSTWGKTSDREICCTEAWLAVGVSAKDVHDSCQVCAQNDIFVSDSGSVTGMGAFSLGPE